MHKTIDSSWKYKFYGEAAKILIQHGATIGAVDEYDRIPLYHAVRRISDTKITDKEREAQKKAVAFFLYQGAHFEHKDCHGLTPYQHAHENEELKRMLKDKDAVTESIEWFKENHKELCTD